MPTVVLGYERRLSADTHLILQGYASTTKYQLSLGVYHRMGRGLLSFGVTENLQNLNNTPDIGFQLGWAYSPALKAED